MGNVVSVVFGQTAFEDMIAQIAFNVCEIGVRPLAPHDA